MLTMIGRAERGQVRQMVLDEGLDAVVVQADRVEHARGRLDRPRRRIARPRLLGDRLRQMPPKRARSTRPAISRA